MFLIIRRHKNRNEKYLYDIRKLKFIQKRSNQNLQSWKNINIGILNNLDKIIEEKNNINKLLKRNYDLIDNEKYSKFFKTLNKHSEIIYSFLNRSKYVIEKNSENLILTVDSYKFLLMILARLKTNLNIKLKPTQYKIRINVDIVQEIIERTIKILQNNIKNNNNIFIYFTIPNKNDTHSYTLFFFIKNGFIYSSRIKEILMSDKILQENLDKYKYILKFNKGKLNDFSFCLKIPKSTERTGGFFNTDYKLKLSGNNSFGGVLEIIKKKTKYNVDLTKTEFRLLYVLIKKFKSDMLKNENYNIAGYLEKYDVVTKVFGNLPKQGNRLSTHLYRLRRKLKDYGLNPDLFQSKGKSLRISTSSSIKNLIID